MEELFKTLLILVGVAIAAIVIRLPYRIGQKGLNGRQSKYDEEVTYNANETTEDVFYRGIKGLLIFLGIVASLSFIGSENQSKLVSVSRLLAAASPFMASYILGLGAAYKASRGRREKGVNELRKTLKESEYILGYDYDLSKFKHFHVEKYPKLYYESILTNSKQFFNDAQKGDLVYFFRLPINKFRLGKTASLVVIYRKKDKKIINVGYTGDSIIELERSS